MGAASGRPKVVVRGLDKVFRSRGKDLVVLSKIDLEVHPGELVCVLGPSGCGKSTLLAIVGGLERATAGVVEIDGQPVVKPDPRRMFVFQENGVFPWASVWDNVALGLRHLPKAERKQRIRHYVELVGLEGFERAYPSELSGGMRQRLAVARSLAVSPDVVFMDEPLGALDSLTRFQMRREILRLWQAERMTILFVTHDVDESIQLADRIVVMSSRPGRIVDIVSVNLPHPRDLGAVEYGAIKKRLYQLLGVDHFV